MLLDKSVISTPFLYKLKKELDGYKKENEELKKELNELENKLNAANEVIATLAEIKKKTVKVK